MLELSWLRHFYFVAKEGGFSRAAEAQRVAQPAVSRAVKLLEDHLGYALFEKRGRVKVLTKRGGDVYRHCEVLFGEVTRIDATRATHANDLRGAFAIGVAEGLAASIAPALIATLSAAHPQLAISMTTSTSQHLCDELRAGKLDACLLLHTPRPFDGLHIAAEQPLVHRLVVSRRAQKRASTLDNFIGSREIDDSGTTAFPTLRRWQRVRPSATIRLSSNSLSAHKQLVLAGVGVAILPEILVAAELRARELAALLPREKFVWPMRLVVRKDVGMTPATAAFAATLPTF